MEFDCEGVRRLLSKYKFRDLTVEELKTVNMSFPHFRYSMDTYGKETFSSLAALLELLFGLRELQNHDFSFLSSDPTSTPKCFVLPPKSVIVGLIHEMIAKFQEELPLYSVPSSAEAQQVDLLAYIAKITEGVSEINSKRWTNHKNTITSKITVVGSGELGIACTLAISAKGIADKLVLLDLSEGTKQGTMDLDIFSLPNVEISKDLSASAHSKVVILTVNSLGNSESYLDAVQSNADAFRALVPALGHYSQHAILLVASQPVEIMTYVTWKLSTFSANRVIGIGCNLDSQRLQYILANVLKAQLSGQEVWVIGEQGEDKVPIWSGQEGVMSQSSWTQLTNRAMELLRVKGQKSWSVGLSVADLVDTIVSNKKKVHSVSILAKGYYGITNEVFLSLPSILGDNGVSEIIRPTVKEDTVTAKLQYSASSIHSFQQQVKL
uniref:Ubiquitin-conjugating enzyme E2 variant 3 n=1 Tax=Jaculus jaculus TaxID=51337 RepID=A0A8C5P0U0_JACJA